MMLTIATKTSWAVTPSLGFHDQSMELMPPVESLACTPVAIMVMPLAEMMETKSMYPRMAISVKDGGTDTPKRMMADTIPKTRPQAPLLVRSLKAMVPVKQCDPETKMSSRSQMMVTTS